MTATEKDLISRLPYRVGLWVCRADDVPGLLDEKIERQKLREVIARVAKHHESSNFVRTALAKTLAQEDQWVMWSTGLESILEECVIGVQMVRAQSREDDAQVYRAVLMQTAISVAEAFQEEKPVEKPAAPPHRAAVPKPKSANDIGIPDNVSQKERCALNDLYAVLWGREKKG